MSERKYLKNLLENLRKSNQESNFLTREAPRRPFATSREKNLADKISISELVKRAGVFKDASLM